MSVCKRVTYLLSSTDFISQYDYLLTSGGGDHCRRLMSNAYETMHACTVRMTPVLKGPLPMATANLHVADIFAK